jgi:hypothetical protein
MLGSGYTAKWGMQQGPSTSRLICEFIALGEQHFGNS